MVVHYWLSNMYRIEKERRLETLNLINSIRRTAYRHYDQTGRRYTLTSGQISDEYVDVKNSILHPEVGGMLATYVCGAMGIGVCDGVAGVELGGALLAQLVAQVKRVPCVVVRKDERSHGTTVLGVDGLENLYTPTSAKPALWLVEDVITTGGSTLKALERLSNIVNVRTIGVVAVVDREQGGIEKIREKYQHMPIKALATLSQVRAGG